jgi:chromosome segregation ATPase
MKIEIPSLTDTHEPYRAIEERRTQLNEKARRLRSQITDLTRRVLQNAGDVNAAERVKDIADGKSPVEKPSLRLEQGQALRELRETEAALEIVEERFRREHHNASRAVCEQFEEMHRMIYTKFWSAIAEAASARCDIDKLHDELNRAGVEVVGPIAQKGSRLFSEPMRRNADVALMLRRAESEGFLKSRQIPEVLR